MRDLQEAMSNTLTLYEPQNGFNDVLSISILVGESLELGGVAASLSQTRNALAVPCPYSREGAGRTEWG